MSTGIVTSLAGFMIRIVGSWPVRYEPLWLRTSNIPASEAFQSRCVGKGIKIAGTGNLVAMVCLARRNLG